MAEKRGKTTRSFISFWAHGFKKAVKKSWGHYGNWLLVFGLMYTGSALALHKNHPVWLQAEWEGFDVSIWMQYFIPGAILVILIIWHLLRAPYEIYLEQNNKHALELQEWGLKVDALNNRITELQAKLSEKSEADKLVIEKRQIKDKLGLKLINLDARLHEARKISLYEFEGQKKDDEWNITNALFRDTQLDLFSFVAELARFMSAKPKPLPEPREQNYLTQRIQDWQWHVNYIEARMAELKEIIREMGQ